MTGCRGIPLGHLTLLTGKSINGKMAVAHQTLANIQIARGRDIDSIAVLDFTQTIQQNDMVNFGVDPRYSDCINPPHPSQTVRLIYSLICGYGYRAVLINGLADVLTMDGMDEMFCAATPKINWALGQTRCAMICLDESTMGQDQRLIASGNYLSQIASLHIDLDNQKERHFITPADEANVQAQLRYSHWALGGSCILDLPWLAARYQPFAMSRIDDSVTVCAIST